ncbi:MAG: CapA family protein [Spirochaetaceae bacterium]
MSKLLFRRYIIPTIPRSLLLLPAFMTAGAAAVLMLGSTGPRPAAPEPPTPEPADAGTRPAASAPATEPAPVSEAEDPRRGLTLTFLGDIMAHTVNVDTEDYRRIYEDVREELIADDLTFANLETPVVPDRPYRSFPRFNVRPEYVEAAAEAGVDVLSVANNHATDQGVEGVEATRSVLEELGESYGIVYNGTRTEPAESPEVTVIEKGGRRIGFVAAVAVLNYPEDGEELVQTVSYHDEAEAGRFIEWVEEQAGEFDLFVISYHGGEEYAREPEPAKVRFFERLVAAGADIVWSHHPHVLQPWRMTRGANGGDALILHSTGNFISGQTWRLDPSEVDSPRAATGDGALFRVTLGWDDEGRLSLGHDPIPITNYRHPRHGMVVRRYDELPAGEMNEAWKRYYVLRRNAMQELIWRSQADRTLHEP